MEGILLIQRICIVHCLILYVITVLSAAGAEDGADTGKATDLSCWHMTASSCTLCCCSHLGCTKGFASTAKTLMVSSPTPPPVPSWLTRPWHQACWTGGWACMGLHQGMPGWKAPPSQCAQSNPAGKSQCCRPCHASLHAERRQAAVPRGSTRYAGRYVCMHMCACLSGLGRGHA